MGDGEYLSNSLGWLTCNNQIQVLGTLRGINVTFYYKKMPIIYSLRTLIISRGIHDKIFVSFYIQSNMQE